MYKTLHPIPLNFLIYEENYIFFFYLCTAIFIFSPSTTFPLVFIPPLHNYCTIHSIPPPPPRGKANIEQHYQAHNIQYRMQQNIMIRESES
jgi:hypothetical protein